MHYDERHEVSVLQQHRAIVEAVTTYTLDSEDYTKFLQIHPDDHFEREEFLLEHGVFLNDETDILDITETIDVTVRDLA